MTRSESSCLRRPPSRQQVAELLEEQKRSGLTIAAFARMHGLPPWKLYEANRARRRQQQQQQTPADFVEVSLALDSKPTAPLEVCLPSGITVRVPSEFDEVALKRLVGVLVAC